MDDISCTKNEGVSKSFESPTGEIFLAKKSYPKFVYVRKTLKKKVILMKEKKYYGSIVKRLLCVVDVSAG